MRLKSLFGEVVLLITILTVVRLVGLGLWVLGEFLLGLLAQLTQKQIIYTFVGIGVFVLLARRYFQNAGRYREGRKFRDYFWF